MPYTELKTKRKNLFAPKAIEITENFKFYNRKQQPQEDISAFTNALNNPSLHCNFGDFKDKALLNQFVVGVRDTRLQRRLLETADLTYDRAVQIAAAMELTDKETTAMLHSKMGQYTPYMLIKRISQNRIRTGRNSLKTILRVTGRSERRSIIKTKTNLHRQEAYNAIGALDTGTRQTIAK